MSFSLENCIQIPILHNDTFHNFFFIRDIQKIEDAILELNSTKKNDNPMIERGKQFGILIVYDKIEQKYYLMYNDISFHTKYTQVDKFREKILEIHDYNDPLKFQTLFNYFDIYQKRKIFNLIKNTDLFKFKCVNLLELPNDYVIKYSHDMRLVDRIKRNPLFNEISGDITSYYNLAKTRYYNFIIDKKGVVIGEVFDSLENGVVHHLLVDNPEDEVYIAGEIKISNNELEYNFHSGTYSAPQNTAKNPFLSYYLEILVSKIFKTHKLDTIPLKKITLVHTFLLPRKIFNRQEFSFFCSRFIDRIVKVPDGNRCINNTYSNLTDTVKEQIKQNFATKNNLLCNEPIDKIFPSVQHLVLPDSDLVKKDNISIVDIENELKKFGLDIKLDTIDKLRDQFYKMISNPLKLATFKDVVVDKDGSTSIEFNRVRSDGSIERKIFTFKQTLSSGSFNKTDIYEDRSSVNFKEYIFRSSISWTLQDQFLSFYENLKHMILYIIIRIRLGNKKFIPQPYHFGLKKNTSGTITLFMIMEKGKSTLDNYIEKSTLSTLDIKKLVFSIYCDLYELSNLYIKDKDISTLLKFKHGDFKCNNLVVSEKGAPLIIDFGFSRFTLTDSVRSINFVSCESPGIYYTSNNGYNVIHDILQLIASFNFIKKPGLKPFTILQFINNKNSNILDTDIITQIINSRNLFVPNAINHKGLFREFYNDFNLEFYESPKYTIEITPLQLAYNIDLSLTDRITDIFEKKYMKYKIKYLKLAGKLK